MFGVVGGVGACTTLSWVEIDLKSYLIYEYKCTRIGRQTSRQGRARDAEARDACNYETWKVSSPAPHLTCEHRGN